MAPGNFGEDGEQQTASQASAEKCFTNQLRHKSRLEKQGDQSVIRVVTLRVHVVTAPQVWFSQGITILVTGTPAAAE
jgi:hypothetical protein